MELKNENLNMKVYLYNIIFILFTVKDKQFQEKNR